MTIDEHALADWLDQPGTEPDEHLDPEVLEAVYALRPDLAPAPRVSADDILASITEGPLALPVSEVPSSLPSPTEQATVAAPEPANRSLASWGGWGGLGLVLAAAATFVLVSLPTLRSGAMESMPAAEQAPAAAALPSPTPVDTGAAKKTAALEEAKPAAPPARRAAPKPRSVPEPPPPPPVAQVPSAPAAKEAYDMADGAPLRGGELIPELADAEDDAVADLGALKDEVGGGDAAEAEPVAEEVAAAPAPAPDAVEAENARRLDDLKAAATSAIGTVPSWESGLSSSEVQRLREVFAAAEAKAATDAVAAGDEASKAIQNPAAVAHHAAELAVDYYLRAGHRQAATSAALKGLQYKTSTASWAHLAVRYADLLRGSDPDEAARWYEQAAAAAR